MQSIINQIQIKHYRNERIDIRYRRECKVKIDEHKENFNKMSIEINKITKENELRQREQAANLSIYTDEPSRRFDYIYDDDEESTIPLNEIVSQIPLSIAITPVLPLEDPEDSLIMRMRTLALFLKRNRECDLPSCDDFSPINISERKYVTFSNPLFDSNDESQSNKDVLEDNFKIYSNHLFEFDDEYISSDVNPLFDEVLEDIESKASYDSNLDELTLLVTPLFVSNEDECFDPGDDIELLLHRDPSTPKMSVVSILEGFTNESPLEDYDDLFDLESKEN
nr:hypothetical protein [Tanacetum cinerariifolium]